MTTRIYVPQTPAEHLFYATWLGRRIGNYNPHGVTTVVCFDDSRIMAVTGFANPHYNRVEVSWASASPNWVTRRNVLGLLSYGFQPHVRALTAVVKRSNKRSRRFIEAIGFINEGTLRKAGEKDENLIVYGMLREEFAELVARFKGRHIAEQWQQVVSNGR